jgi:hypothetical protein
MTWRAWGRLCAISEDAAWETWEGGAARRATGPKSTPASPAYTRRPHAGSAPREVQELRGDERAALGSKRALVEFWPPGVCALFSR